MGKVINKGKEKGMHTEACAMWQDHVLSPVDIGWRQEREACLETVRTDPDTNRRYCGNQQHWGISGLSM